MSTVDAGKRPHQPVSDPTVTKIHRIIQTHTPPEDMDLALLSHISPVSWENVILYGDYILNRNKVTL